HGTAHHRRSPQRPSPGPEPACDDLTRRCQTHRSVTSVPQTQISDPISATTSAILINGDLDKRRGNHTANQSRGPPCPRQSSLILAAFRPWGGSRDARRTRGSANITRVPPPTGLGYPGPRRIRLAA